MLKKISIVLNRPEPDDECIECQYYHKEDQSFDHEFGTEHRFSHECNAPNDFLNYGDCGKVIKYIDDNFNSDAIDIMEIETE
jgi:hypothetical protein